MTKTDRKFEFELVPSRFKDFAETDIRTIAGKRNRIAIGLPRCIREDPLASSTLLTAQDQLAYPATAHRFYRVAFDVTLHPDDGCQFVSADLVFILQPDRINKKLPLILHLNPQGQGTKMAVKIKSDDTAKMKLSPPMLKFLSAEVGGSSSLEVGYEKFEASLSAFGAGTREAGWRFETTEGAEIPLCTPALELLVVLPREFPAQARFRLAAKIKVRSPIDRWLTELFTRDRPAEADYAFPDSD
jgi:hypothetical protein